MAAGGTLVVAVFNVFVRRYLVCGLTAGGVKE
jgi:ABC-type glycerol-3-phosphate transport system permease component